MSWADFAAERLGASQNCSATGASGLPADGAVAHAAPAARGAPPAAVDWRATIPLLVKDQGSCGSCWTFSTTGAVEAHHFLATGENVSLAPQQLVDCAGAFDNAGCNGGLPSHAFEYLHYFGGQMLEADYPYTAKDGKCVADAAKAAATVSSQVNITFEDEDMLVGAVGRFGPVSVAFQVASDFQHYSGGVYTSTVCGSGPEDVNHAVLAVGYDHDAESGLDYWIIKNSWGTEWGVENGYFFMERGSNMCGVADCVVVPHLRQVSGTGRDLGRARGPTRSAHLKRRARRTPRARARVCVYAHAAEGRWGTERASTRAAVLAEVHHGGARRERGGGGGDSHVEVQRAAELGVQETPPPAQARAGAPRSKRPRAAVRETQVKSTKRVG